LPRRSVGGNGARRPRRGLYFAVITA